MRAPKGIIAAVRDVVEHVGHCGLEVLGELTACEEYLVEEQEGTRKRSRTSSRMTPPNSDAG